jgi:hypothetical protein
MICLSIVTRRNCDYTRITINNVKNRKKIYCTVKTPDNVFEVQLPSELVTRTFHEPLFPVYIVKNAVKSVFEELSEYEVEDQIVLPLFRSSTFPSAGRLVP